MYTHTSDRKHALNKAALHRGPGKIGRILFILVFFTHLVGVPIASAQASSTITFSGEELLGRPTDTSITINVVPDEQVNIYYEYGTAPGTYTAQTSIGTAAAGEPYEVVISDLQPNTRYYYRMQYQKPGDAWVARSEHSFWTQRAEGETFSFTVTSDSHVNIMLGNATTWRQTMTNVANNQPDFHIDLGDTFAMDNVTTVAGAEAAYLNQRDFFDLVGHSAPIFLAAGNHEQQEGWHLDDTGNPATSQPVLGTNAQKKYYPNPVPDGFYTGDTDPYPHLSGDQLREDYYAWTWGDALFVVINPYWFTTVKPFTGNTGGGESSDTGSGDRWDWTLGQQQFNWLKQTLEGSDAKYKFIFAHHMVGGSEPYVRGGAAPAHLFEWGGYNANGTYGFETERPGWGPDAIHDLMVDNHVSAFFHGHDHQYAHEERDGIVYQALPSAGFSGNGFNIYTASDPYLVRALNSPGHLRVTVTPAETTVDYIASGTSNGSSTPTVNGAVNYSYTIAPASSEPTFDLTVAVDPAGSGTTSPAAGTHRYVEGSVVDITATPNAGYAFNYWSGACTGSGACQVTMDGDASVTAHFIELPASTISYLGTIGTATDKTSADTLSVVTTAGVAAGDTIIVSYATCPNESLQVSVTDSVGNTYEQAALARNYGNGRTYIFAAYDVDPLPSGSTIDILSTITSGDMPTCKAAAVDVFRGLASSGTLDQALGNPTFESESTISGTTPSVGPTGVTVRSDELLVGVVGTNGPVEDTAGVWGNSFIEGPRTGTTGGDATSNWTVSMGYRIVSAIGAYSAQKSGITNRNWAAAIATFKAGLASVTHELTVAVDPPGAGTTDPAAGVHVYDENAVVPVTATPADGYVFDHWSGACTGTGPCQVTMSADQTVTAHFSPAPVGGLTYIGDIGSGSIKNSSNPELVITTNAPVAAGNDIIIAYATDPTQDLTISVTDSAGNKYQQAAMAISVGNLRTYIFAAYDAAPLPAGSAITIRQTVVSSTAVAARAAVVSLFDGLAPVGALEQTSVGSQTGGTTPSSGAVTTVYPNQLLIGAVGTEGPATDNAGTWLNSFTAGPRTGTTATTGDAEITISMGWQIVSSAGSYTAAKSGITARDSATAIATFKTADAGISYIGNIGAAQSKTAGTSLAITTDTDVAAGDDILVVFAADPGATISGLNDSAGNTYTLVTEVANGNNVRTAIYAAYNVRALPSGSTITINHASATARTAVVSAFRGLADSDVVDRTRTATGSTNAVSTGATDTTTQADELLIGAVGLEGPNGDAPSVWQNSFTFGPRFGTNFGATGGGDTDITVQMGWRIVGSTGAYTAQLVNLNTVRDWAAAIATFKAGAAGPTCYTLTLDHTGQGSDPTASPASSTGCAAGQYVAGETISLGGAVPASGWEISGWSGTDDDSSTAAGNTLTMPANDHTVLVQYVDLTAPNTTITAQPPNPSTSADASFSFTSSETGSTFECRLDGGAYTACTSPKQYTGLADGSHTFEVRATDPQGNTDPTPASYTWVVDAVNDPPVIAQGASTEVTMSEDGVPTAFSLTLNATDADSASLTWSISTDPENGTASVSGTGTGLSATVDYTPNLNYHGTDSFVVQVADGSGGTDTITVNVTITPVNDAPVAVDDGYTTEKNTTLNVPFDSGVLANDTDVEEDPLTAVKASDPEHGTLTLNADGSFSYVPETNWSGTDSFTYRASDGTDQSDPATVTIEVSSGQVPPLPSSFYGEIHILDNPPAVGDKVEVYLPGAVTPIAAFEIKQELPGLVYEGNVPGDIAGTSEIEGGVDGDLLTFKIAGRVVAAAEWHSGTNTSLNLHPPQALPGGPYTGTPGAAVSFSGSANDWGNDALTYQWDWENDGEFDATGASASHTWTAVGTYTAVLKVTDAQGGEGSATFTVEVENAAPVLAPIGDKTVAELVELSFTASATDSDPLTYSLMDAPDGAAIDAKTGLFTWTPSEAQGPGNFTFTVKVCDNAALALCDEESITVTVTEVNVAPVLNSIGSKSVAELVELSFTASATDADLPANELRYSLVDAPDGAAINAETGVFTWTPTEAQGPGNFTFTVKVCDDADPALCDEESITVSVTEVNVAPVLAPIGNQTVVEGTPLSFTATATDDDLPANELTYSLVGAPDGAAIDAETGLFTWTPTEAQGPGDHTFTVKVCDDADPALCDEETIVVTVTSGTLTHSLSLVAGWNLVSFNLHPQDTAIAEVLASVAGNYDLVYASDAAGEQSTTGNWLKYAPGGAAYQNTLTSLDEQMGFWIHMTAADTLEVSGTVVESSSIPLTDLASGWNLVGYPSAGNRTLPEALSEHGVGESFSLVFSYHANDTVDPWKLFDRTAPDWGQDLAQMEPGWGYWILVDADSTWSVDYSLP